LSYEHPNARSAHVAAQLVVAAERDLGTAGRQGLRHPARRHAQAETAAHPPAPREPEGLSVEFPAVKAAVCHGFGEPLVVEDIELDPPGRGEVRVRVAACAVCHSDVAYASGAWGGQGAVLAGAEPIVALDLAADRRAMVEIEAAGLAHDGIRILGSKLGSTRPALDVPRLARLYLDGRPRLDELISSRSPLGAINEALASAARGEALRAVITL
jgi:Zn-dependent alcohol dehydrogenase